MGHSDSQGAEQIALAPEAELAMKRAQLGIAAVDWNRSLAAPLIAVGHEIAVAEKIAALAKAISEAEVPKSPDGNYHTGDEDLDLLLGLTEDMAEGRGNMDVGMLWVSVLERVMRKLKDASAKEPRNSVDRFLTDHLRLWKDLGVPAPVNELQSIQAWLRHLGEHGPEKTKHAMRGRMTLLTKASIELHKAGPEAEDAAGIYNERSRAEMAAAAQSKTPKKPCFYVASRASEPARAEMWVRLRDVDGYRINSTWIDAVVNQTPVAYEELWPRICEEVSRCDCLVLYVQPEDFPLRGAFVEVGMALAAGKPVRVVAPGVPLAAEDFKPLGSWAKHPLVHIVSSVERAFASLDPA